MFWMTQDLYGRLLCQIFALNILKPYQNLERKNSSSDDSWNHANVLQFHHPNHKSPNHNSAASSYFGPIVEVVAGRTAKVLCLNECADHGPCVEQQMCLHKTWILKEYHDDIMAIMAYLHG